MAAAVGKMLLDQLRLTMRRQQHEKLDANRRPDLLAWGRRYLADHFSRPASTMHRWLARRLAEIDERPRRGVKLNVLGPRGSAKSTVATLAFVLRSVVEGRQPYVWIVSDSRAQAEAHLENIKLELVENARLRRDYPEAVGEGPVWRRGAIRLRNGVAVEAFGTGQRIRGRRYRHHRPTLLVCDDLQNDRHVLSAAGREQCVQWFHGTLMRAGDERTSVIHLATALHRDALAMRLCRTPGWRSRVFRSIERWPRRMDLWREWELIYSDADDSHALRRANRFFERHRALMIDGAGVLWPEVEDLYALMRLRAESGPAAFAREKQNEPLSPELCEWPERYFDEAIWFEQWPRHLRLKTMALDPSKGADARRGDYSAFVMLGMADDGRVYIEADMARRPVSQIVADGVALYRRFRPDAFGVEANQFQQLLADAFEDEFRRQGVMGVRPWLVDNRVNKRVRIRRLGPYLASGRLRFKADCVSTRLLVEQLREFPLADHDDGPDAAEMALRLASEYCEGQRPPDDLGQRLEVG